MDAREQDKIERVLTMIMTDAEADARSLDEQLFNGRTAGVNFGKVYASIHALAAICRQLLDAVNVDDDGWTCPTCKGTRTIQPDRCSPPEPCPQCVNEDEEDMLATWARRRQQYAAPTIAQVMAVGYEVEPDQADWYGASF